MAASTCAGSKLKVTGSMSTKTGVAPAITMVVAEATKENAEGNTSSPGVPLFRPAPLQGDRQRVGAGAGPQPVPRPAHRASFTLEGLALGTQDEAAGVD